MPVQPDVIRIHDACSNGCLQGGQYALDRGEPRLVDPISNIGHEHRVALARVNGRAESTNVWEQIIVEPLRHSFVDIYDRWVRPAFDVAGGKEQRGLQSLVLLALIVD